MATLDPQPHYARLDPKILRPISYRAVAQQEALTLIRARNLVVCLRTAAVNAVRGLAKPSGYRLPASSTCWANLSDSYINRHWLATRLRLGERRLRNCRHTHTRPYVRVSSYGHTREGRTDFKSEALG